jgi:hypothetical protein
VLCSQHRAKDRSGTPATFDDLHRRSPHHGQAASGTEPPCRHLLQHLVGVLLLTDISSGASDLPSDLPPLSTPAARTPPWTANPSEPPSFPTPKSVCRTALVLLAPSSPILACRHHMDSQAAASLACSLVSRWVFGPVQGRPT